MNVNDKIKQILIDKSISPSVFADEIGVQRSSISHILSGRNRPSFDIIQKIIRRFPDLGYDWIMKDDSSDSQLEYPVKSTPPIRPARETNQPSQSGSFQPRTNRTLYPGDFTASESTVKSPATTPSELPVAVATPEKTVERILIFYKDGTFREYTPAGY